MLRLDSEMYSLFTESLKGDQWYSYKKVLGDTKVKELVAALDQGNEDLILELHVEIFTLFDAELSNSFIDKDRKVCYNQTAYWIFSNFCKLIDIEESTYHESEIIILTSSVISKCDTAKLISNEDIVTLSRVHIMLIADLFDFNNNGK